MSVRRDRVLFVRTAGKYANDEYGLAKRLGHAVKRADRAKLRAVAGLKRKVPVMAKRAVVDEYNIPKSKLAKSFRVHTTPVTLNLLASGLKFGLEEFGGKWGGRRTPGATAEIIRGKRTSYRHAFMARGRRRGRETELIYLRRSAYLGGSYAVDVTGHQRSKQAKVRRDPILALGGPSAYMMVSGRDSSGKIVYPRIYATLEEEMITWYVRELRRLYAVEARG